MPERFPVHTGDGFTEVDHYSLGEVADLFHMHRETARRLMRTEQWPHLRIGKVAWFTEADVAEILAHMRRNGVSEDTGEGAGPLGVVMPPEADDGPPVVR